MTPLQEDDLRNAANELALASLRLVRALDVPRRRGVVLPSIPGRPPSEVDTSASEVFEHTLGALARAHGHLVSRGVGLLRSRPIHAQLAGGLTGIDSDGRPRLRLHTKGSR